MTRSPTKAHSRTPPRYLARLAGQLSLLVGLSLLASVAVAGAESTSSQSSSGSATTSSQSGRSASDSRLLSTKPARGNGVKTRVLTRDGRVRDIVVEGKRLR